MKPATKIIIFLVVAFIIIIAITFAMRGDAPAAPEATPTETATSTPTSTATSTPTAQASYTLAEVAMHKTAADCWTAVNGNVYNLTSFVSKHPGGVANITKICGIDGTATFTQMHGSNANAQNMIATLKIGTLK